MLEMTGFLLITQGYLPLTITRARPRSVSVSCVGLGSGNIFLSGRYGRLCTCTIECVCGADLIIYYICIY